MKINVAAPVLLAATPKPTPSPPKDAPHLGPADIDLTRKLAFGDSEVDEAAVVLVEMSILVYERLDQIRETSKRLPFDDVAAFDKGQTRDDDWSWIAIRALSEQIRLHPLIHPLGFQLSPEIREQLRAELERRKITLPIPPKPVAPVAKPSTVKPDAEWIRRTRPPRVLALLHGNCALIAFRGTAGFSDWCTDAKFWPAARLPWRHCGFEQTWQGVKPQVEAWLEKVARKLGRRPQIYLAGHSLGGAVATLAAVDLAPNYDIARVVTIGSPRVGGRGFCNLYQKMPAATAKNFPARRLPDVTTRWVHGNDLFATFIPPPLISTHVIPELFLKPSDRIDIQHYLPSNLMDTSPLMNLLVPTAPPAVPGVLPKSQPASRTQNLRQLVSQMALWGSLTMPWAPWIRFLLPLLPVLTEDMVRSGFRHKSARYLGFMPPTALYRAMRPAQTQLTSLS